MPLNANHFEQKIEAQAFLEFGVNSRGARVTPGLGPNLGSISRSRRICEPVSQILRAVQTGGLPDLDLSFLFCPFMSFLGLSRFFWDFPDLLGDGPGIFPICPFPLSRLIKSTYEEQSRKGPRHNLDLSRKKRETPRFGTPPV